MINILATIFVFILVILLWVMVFDSNRFVIVRHSLSDRRIKKPCRAVVLADLHNKCYGKNNEQLLAAVKDCKPDFILVAGDIPTAKKGKGLEIAISLMSELAKDYPVYYASGNHEHRMKLYPETYGDMGERYEEALREAGVHRLVNEHISLEENGIQIYGSEIDKSFYKRFGVQPMGADYMESILGKSGKGQYTVLIAHNPDYFPQYAAWGADLVLSGHIHGGIVRVPIWGKGIVSPNVRLFPKYDGGIFKEDKSTMLLSRGLGMHTIPVRLFNPGELLVVDFEPDKGTDVLLEKEVYY
ncbi:MAG: metallophosphoesterase [Acetatifactor sp.]